MKWLSLCILFTLTWFLSFAQPFIHAHNDYHPPEQSPVRAGKPEPLTNALRHKVFSVEADIYLSGNRPFTFKTCWVSKRKQLRQTE